MNRIFLLFPLVLLLFFGAREASGQQLEGHQLTIRSGLGWHNEVDDIVSMLHYRSSFIPVSLSYGHTRNKRTHHIQIGLITSTLTNEFNTNDRTYFYMELEYSYRNKLTDLQLGRYPLLLNWGLAWLNRGTNIHQQINGKELNDNGYFHSALAVQLSVHRKIHKRHGFEYRIDLPLLTYLKRPEYKFTGKFDAGSFHGGFEFPHTGNRLVYRYRASRSLILHTTFDFRFNRLGDQPQYQSVDRSLLLGITIGL